MKCVQTGIFGVNTWLISLCANAILIIDPDCNKITNDDKEFINFLKKNNYVPAGIVLTHGHFDHIAGTKILKENFPFAKIAIHKNDSEMIGKNAFKNQREILYEMGIGNFSSSLENLPDADVFLDESKNLSEVFDVRELKNNAEFSKMFSDSEMQNSFENLENALSDWKIIHTPGHTKGSVCLYNEKKNHLVSGDTIFYLSYGRTDLPGGSDSEMKKSLEKIKEKVSPDAIVFPGHDRAGFPLKQNFLIF